MAYRTLDIKFRLCACRGESTNSALYGQRANWLSEKANLTPWKHLKGLYVIQNLTEIDFDIIDLIAQILFKQN